MKTRLNRTMRFAASVAVIVFCILPAVGQQTSVTVTRDNLPPSAILTDELTFLDRIRSDMANWSDVELAAFQATTAKAKVDCARIEQTPHEGEEELALARLCSLGWDWDGAYSAARWYTRKSAPPEQATHLTTGFALLLRADLNLQATTRALDDLKEMHERVVFNDDADTIFAYTISTLEVMRPAEGITAAMLRQTALLDAVAGKNASVSAGRAEAEAWHVLSLLHASGRTEDEAAQKALLTQAVAARTSALSASDLYAAQRGRAVYEWFGREAPKLNVLRSTYPIGGRHAAAPVKATLLVIETAEAADAAALSLAVDSLRTHLAPGTEASLVLLGAPPSSTAKRPLHAEYTRDALMETFSAESGPLFVVLDGDGHVTWLGTGTAVWLNPQQQAEVLLGRVTAK